MHASRALTTTYTVFYSIPQVYMYTYMYVCVYILMITSATYMYIDFVIHFKVQYIYIGTRLGQSFDHVDH